MVSNICCNCGKYVFDKQNIKLKRMTAAEYVEAVVRPILRLNITTKTIIKKCKYDEDGKVNKSKCELCGAPHAVWSKDGDEEVTRVHFFYSGNNKPSDKDDAFINEFRSSFLSR